MAQKAISIRQPWAWLITHGYKPVENRDWRTNYRGPVYIHAGKRVDRDAYEWLNGEFPDICSLVPPADEIETGGIVGKCKIIDCVDNLDSPWFFGDYGFILSDASPLPLIPLSGKLGIFNINVDIPQQIGKLSVANVSGLRGADRNGVHYIGRSFAGWSKSVLHNPYRVGNNRQTCIEQYRRHLWRCIRQNDANVLAELKSIVTALQAGQDVRLGCWCAPNACHGDIVADCVKWMMSAE